MTLALVTGAGGLVGAALARALSDRGVRVRALEHRARVAFADERVRGSLLDPKVRAEAVRGAGAVYHCAARIDPASDDEMFAINERATIALAREAKAAGARSFVFVSSQAALGTKASGLLDETAACDPESAYGRSKLAAERGLAALAPMRVTIVRPPLVYGPGERRGFLTIARAISSGVFPIFGRGDNRLSLCHVENLVEAIVVAESRGGLYHVADARPVTQREAVHTIARALDVRAITPSIPLPAARIAARGAELLFAPSGRRAPFDRRRLAALAGDRALDTARIASLGFVPPVAFDDGVRETIDSYRADGVLR